MAIELAEEVATIDDKIVDTTGADSMSAAVGRDKDMDVPFEAAVGISDEVVIVTDVLCSTSAAETEETLAGAVETGRKPGCICHGCRRDKS